MVIGPLKRQDITKQFIHIHFYTVTIKVCSSIDKVSKILITKCIEMGDITVNKWLSFPVKYCFFFV